MYKVMLVDDDIPVLEYFEKAVPWASLGLQLEGVYDSSKKALEAAMISMPDILITDIGMPEIDGLELVKRLKTKSSGLKVLIASCHNEFAYAQQALKLNVHEYLLKETISVESITQVLQSLIQELETQNAILQQTERLKQFENQHRSVIKVKLLRELLYAPLWDYRDWIHQCMQHGFDLRHDSIIPVLCHVDRYSDIIRKLRLNDETFAFAIDNVASEFLHSKGSGVFLPLDSKTAVLLFPVSSSLHINAFEMVKEQLHGIQAAIAHHLKSSTSYFVGNKMNNSQLRSGLTELLVERDKHFYDKDGMIRSVNKEPFATEDLFIHYAEAEQELKRHLVNDNSSELKEVLKKWIAFMIHKRYHPSTVKEWVLKLMLDILIKLRTLKHYNSSYSEEVVHQKISQMDSIYHLEDWLLNYMEHITFPMNFSSIQNSIIVKAQNYVAHHMEEKISMETVAGHLHLNPSYFSRTYKQDTGEGFIKYVTRVKMQAACMLLDSTNKTIEEISDQLGYENTSYFNKCFKNVLQISPTEYRGQK
jgi:two-component system response regulator YesN